MIQKQQILMPAIIALKAFKQPVILLMGGFDKGLDLSALKTLSSKH